MEVTVPSWDQKTARVTAAVLLAMRKSKGGQTLRPEGLKRGFAFHPN